jgi:hypothetical protein
LIQDLEKKKSKLEKKVVELKSKIEVLDKRNRDRREAENKVREK